MDNYSSIGIYSLMLHYDQLCGLSKSFLSYLVSLEYEISRFLCAWGYEESQLHAPSTYSF